MIEISIKHNLKEAMKRIELLQRRHIPFATAKALTEVAITAAKKTKTEIRQVFDRPTPYAQNSVRWEKATPEKQVARVWVKNKLDAGKGNTPEDFLLPEVFGGPRKRKRFEIALIARGIMPSGYFAVAGGGAQLDAFGNVSAGQIRQILSYFGAAQRTAGYSANMTDKNKDRLRKGTKTRMGFSYFVAGPGVKGGGGGHLFPGVYKRIQTAFGISNKPILIFVKRKPSYRMRLNMDAIVRKTLDKDLAYEFDRAMRMAIATSSAKGFWRAT